jgi:hypothetical protein
VQKRFLNFDPEREKRCLPMSDTQAEYARVSCDPGTTIHPECLLSTRNKEEEADVGIVEQVPHSVQSPVTGSIRNRKTMVIKDSDKPRRIALRGHIATTVLVRRGD